MVAIQRVGSIVLTALLLAACGSAEEPRKPPPVEETVFSGAAAAEQKARDVQKVMDERPHTTDRAIEEGEGAQ
jgi:hypothetical protein